MLLEKEVKFDEQRKQLGNMLICPHCGCHVLRHGTVIVFNRDEDAEITQVTTANNGQSKMELLPSETCGNPSYRQDGLTIDFRCKKCENSSELAIYHHKGMTFFEWR